MNVAKQFVRLAVSCRPNSRTLASVRPYISDSLRLTQFTHKRSKASLLQPCATGPIKSHQMSSAQQGCKFEVINVQDEDDFKKRVLESNKPVVVDFHASWCGSCRLLGPRLEKLVAEENGKVIMAKVDIDENSDLAMEYGVRSVPTVLGMKDGKVLSHFIGLVDDDQIQTFVDKLLVS